MAHDEPGDPGRGSIPEEEGDLFIVLSCYICCRCVDSKVPSVQNGVTRTLSEKGGKLGRPWYCVFIFRKIYLYRYEIDKSLRYQALDKNEG
jgi:hypothetical protein